MKYYLAHFEPGHIGFSSVGGHLGLSNTNGQALHIVVGPGGKQVLAPIAPGLIKSVPITSHRLFPPGEEIPISVSQGLVALEDGEREFDHQKQMNNGRFSLDPHGPRVLDIAPMIGRAAEQGIFLDPANHGLKRVRRNAHNPNRFETAWM